MRLFVAGGTGVVGRRAVARLAAAGHAVSALVRSDEKAALVREMGATPVAVDLFDPAGLKAAVDGHDAVVNVATKVPPPSQAARTGAWAENGRIRTEGSRNLVDAALSAAVGRYVQESIAFVYPDRGAEWIDEDVPLDPPKLARPNVAAEAQAARFTDAGGAGVVLRFGQFYAPESMHSRYMARMVRMRLPALPGPHGAYSPAISADDAAAAVVAALEVPAGTWNVVDDEPLTRREYNRAVADAVGAKPPVTTGALLLRFSPNTSFYLRSHRVSNARFKEASGWSPRDPNARAGWQRIAKELA